MLKLNDTAANTGAQNSNAVKGLFFRTNTKYHADTFLTHDPEIKPESNRSYIYYSVVEHHGSFFANHYAGVGEKPTIPSWQQVDEKGLVFAEFKSALEI